MTPRGLRSSRGQATVELALCLPIAVIVLAALFEAVTVASDQVRLWHAAREAARAAAVDSDAGAARAAARSAGLRSFALSIQPQPAHRSFGRPLTVTLAHRHEARTPFLGRIFEVIVLRADATMRIEQP